MKSIFSVFTGGNIAKVYGCIFTDQGSVTNYDQCKVFGSSNAAVFWLMVKGFLLPVLAGAVIAIASAYLYIERWLSEYPVRIESTIWIYAVSVIIILAVVVISISFQAFKLMRINPTEALKKE